MKIPIQLSYFRRFQMRALRLGLINMALRGFSLIARFGLTLYIAKYLDLGAVGAFGLIYGIMLLAPPFLGFGLDYSVSREIVGMPIEQASLKIRDRLIVTGVAYLTAAAIAIVAMACGLIHRMAYVSWVVVIGLLEAIAFDAHFMLIAVHKSVLANTVAFMRTASWIFPFVGLGLILPIMRTFHALLFFWLAGDIAAFFVLAIGLRHWPWRLLLFSNFDYAWFKKHLRHCWTIFLSDIGNTGGGLLDRYIVNYFLGLQSTGIYTFFWSLASGVQMLVYYGVVQVSLPHVVSSARSADPHKFGRTLRNEFIKAYISSVLLGVAIYICSMLIIRYLHRPELYTYTWLFPAMLFAITLRSLSDVANQGLYARHYDGRWVVANVVSIFMTILSSVLALYFFGLGSMGFALTANQFVLLILRLYSLRPDLRAGFTTLQVSSRRQ